MATPFVLTDVTAWVDGLELTTSANEVSLSLDVDDVDVTCFGGGGYKQRIGGLRNFDLGIKGLQLNDASIDGDMFSNLAATRVATITPDGAAGSAAYFVQAKNFSYNPVDGGIGDAAKFEAKLMGSDGVGVVRGLLTKAKGSVSATGATGSAVQLGAGSAGKYLYAVLHVFTAGTTLSLKVQSDDNSGFTSATDVASATITGVTAVGGTWMTRVDASAITDDWFRINVTTCTGTFNIACALAIQ